MNAEAYVHLGQWTNWADGRVKGPRLTLTESDGPYLIAILALFVRLAGQHSWGLLCYVIFHYRRRNTNTGENLGRDPLQSILRNAEVDTTAAWQFLSLRWRLEPARKSLLGHSIFCMLLAVCHAVLFIAAGVFVSKATVTGNNKVLLRGQACGIWQDPADFDLYSSGSAADLLENTLWASWSYQTATDAADFSRQCYNTTAADSALANCNAYAPELLTWTIEENVLCPFEENMCRDGLAVRFDSGYLDSLHHFGINAQPGDRVKYRRVVECSPLTRDGYVSEILNESEVNWGVSTQATVGAAPPPYAAYQEFYYGPNLSFNLTSTYLWNNSTLGPNYGNMQALHFDVDTELYVSDSPDWGTFLAIEELNRTDADVVVYFLLTTMYYLSPVHDPWFQATTAVPGLVNAFVNGVQNGTLPMYRSDYDASVMGCAQQFQYCNHDASKCSILTGEGYGGSLNSSIGAFAEGLNLNIKQQSTLSRLVQASWNQDMYIVAYSPIGLLVQANNLGEWSQALPDNQWILEMQHYFLSGLTGVQMQLASYATGPPDKSCHQYLTKPTADEEWMCSSQIVQRSGYATFSILGIVIVLVVGGLFIVTNLALPAVSGKIALHSRKIVKGDWEGYLHLHVPSGHDMVELTSRSASSPDTNSVSSNNKFALLQQKPGVVRLSHDNTDDFDTNIWTSTAYTSYNFSRDNDSKIRRTLAPSSRPRKSRFIYGNQGSEGSNLMADLDRV